SVPGGRKILRPSTITQHGCCRICSPLEQFLLNFFRNPAICDIEHYLPYRAVLLLADEALLCAQHHFCSASHSAISWTHAATVARRLWSRLPSKRSNFTVVFSSDASAMNVKPTALPSDGSGPATPVVDMPISV